MAITCPPGTFSIQTLLLYFCHLHSLLFVLLYIILSLTWRISISGGRSVRGKITCFSFGKIFSILRPHSSNLFYWFRLSLHNLIGFACPRTRSLGSCVWQHPYCPQWCRSPPSFCSPNDPSWLFAPFHSVFFNFEILSVVETDGISK